jgi:hypothetical protein
LETRQGSCFSTVWCSHNDDEHPKEELAKFGYWVIVEIVFKESYYIYGEI